MADTATTRYGARKQSLGSNVNTWGDTKLNDSFDIFDRGSKGYQSVTLTGDQTLTWTSYATTNTGQVQVLRFGGSLSASATVTVPSVEWVWDVINASGAQVTVKTSAGTGIAIPNGRTVRIYCDATDVYSAVPNYLPVDITETNNRDLIDYAALNTAIANATTITATGAVKITSSDTTAKFVRAAFTTSISGALNLQLSTLNAGGNEQVLITGSVGGYGLTAGADQTTSFNAAVNTFYVCNFSAAATITLPSSASVGDKIGFALGGGQAVTVNPNGLKINASTSNLVLAPGRYTEFISYTGTTDGWV